MRLCSAKKRRAQVRDSGLWSQYQLAVRRMPCAALQARRMHVAAGGDHGGELPAHR